ncbi:hypothetical protein M408DRAFT_181646 [Serendipita vermifera MAFF 305830]|uniref:Uncharacterized protein n=1 Tax=Serendipita vermifera MAFF 305830 TaxID=933852 RepID=A0A0C3B539_SERVB|nr:hypothetical protein M408DRAFT_181646 [Serendipita vermifera MAFF 305830]
MTACRGFHCRNKSRCYPTLSQCLEDRNLAKEVIIPGRQSTLHSSLNCHLFELGRFAIHVCCFVLEDCASKHFSISPCTDRFPTPDLKLGRLESIQFNKRGW